MTRILLFFGVALFTSLSLQAQAPAVKHAVMLSAVVQESPARITLQWLNDDVNATGYNVNRRTPGSGAWGSPLATLPAGTTIYEDNDVMVGTSYEYRVTKIAAAYTGYGYLTAGIKIPETEQRGVVSGMLNLARNLGLITGASAMGAVFALASGVSDVATARPDSVAHGMGVTYAVAFVLIVAAIVIAVGDRPRRRSMIARSS